MTKKNMQETICAVDYAFRRLGGKYKGRILWYLHRNGIMRYGSLLKAIADIAPKMLTQTLRELEEDGLVHRESFHELPPRVEYSLTSTGKELIPIIDQLREWGDQQLLKNNLPASVTVLACVDTKTLNSDIN